VGLVGAWTGFLDGVDFVHNTCYFDTKSCSVIDSNGTIIITVLRLQRALIVRLVLRGELVASI